MSEWINVKDRYPNDGEQVIIKIYDIKTDKFYELDAIFTDNDDYRSWKFLPPEGSHPVSMPEQWKPTRPIKCIITLKEGLKYE